MRRIESATQPPANESPASAVSMDREMLRKKEGTLRKKEGTQHIALDPGAEPPASKKEEDREELKACGYVRVLRVL